MSHIFPIVLVVSATSFVVWYLGPRLWSAMRTGRLASGYDRDRYPARYYFVIVTFASAIATMVVLSLAVIRASLGIGY